MQMAANAAIHAPMETNCSARKIRGNYLVSFLVVYFSSVNESEGRVSPAGEHASLSNPGTERNSIGAFLKI